MPITVECLTCGTKFQARPSEGRKFCGSVCYRLYEKAHGRQRPVEETEFTCASCGKPFFFKPGHLRSYRKHWGKDPLYCSRKCAGEAKRLAEGKTCVVCGKPISPEWRDGRTRNGRNKLCSTECRKAFKLAEHERLRPLAERQVSRMPGRHGYIRLRIPRTETEPKRDILEHRYVMEKTLGRSLYLGETVHHKNGDRTDNRLENLELFSKNHGPGQRVRDIVAYAIDALNRYPEFCSEAGYRLVKIADAHDLICS